MGNDPFVSLVVSLIAVLVLWSPATARREVGANALFLAAATAVLLLVTRLTDGPTAYGSLALLGVWQAWQARTVGTRALVMFGLSALALGVAALALARGRVEIAFHASLLAIALRSGLVPLHAGVSELCERAIHRQIEQTALLVGLVFAHLRFVDHIPLAHDLAAVVVRIGATMTLLPGLVALVQRDVRGFFRTASLMHGGMVVAAVGAAGRGHHAAALMVSLTTTIALGGLGMMVMALETRAGRVLIAGKGGRVQALPRLAAAFALFGAAGVAMPGTAGFIADDLMLHALWGESVGATMMIIFGAALLAVATLRTYAGAFLGPAQPTLAPDLRPRERALVGAMLLLLLALGLVPGLLLTPADAMFRASVL